MCTASSNARSKQRKLGCRHLDQEIKKKHVKHVVCDRVECFVHLPLSCTTISAGFPEVFWFSKVQSVLFVTFIFQNQNLQCFHGIVEMRVRLEIGRLQKLRIGYVSCPFLLKFLYLLLRFFLCITNLIWISRIIFDPPDSRKLFGLISCGRCRARIFNRSAGFHPLILGDADCRLRELGNVHDAGVFSGVIMVHMLWHVFLCSVG